MSASSSSRFGATNSTATFERESEPTRTGLAVRCRRVHHSWSNSERRHARVLGGSSCRAGLVQRGHVRRGIIASTRPREPGAGGRLLRARRKSSSRRQRGASSGRRAARRATPGRPWRWACLHGSTYSPRSASSHASSRCSKRPMRPRPRSTTPGLRASWRCRSFVRRARRSAEGRVTGTEPSVQPRDARRVPGRDGRHGRREGCAPPRHRVREAGW